VMGGPDLILEVAEIGLQQLDVLMIIVGDQDFRGSRGLIQITTSLEGPNGRRSTRSFATPPIHLLPHSSSHSTTTSTERQPANPNESVGGVAVCRESASRPPRAALVRPPSARSGSPPHHPEIYTHRVASGPENVRRVRLPSGVVMIKLESLRRDPRLGSG